MRTLYFITSNNGKFLEAKEKLRPLGFSVIQKDLGYPEIQAEHLEDVVLQGITHVRMRFNESFILEDAGLFIEVLRGFPGVYSKYVFFTIGLPGILRLLSGVKDRKPVFRSVYAYSEPLHKPIIFVGECNGTISTKQRGKNGFGYDPIFLPKGLRRTFGEMTTNEKNRYSHRSKALDKLILNLKKDNNF
jgi:XTP/dITP diphosphohydrolase